MEQILCLITVPQPLRCFGIALLFENVQMHLFTLLDGDHNLPEAVWGALVVALGGFKALSVLDLSLVSEDPQPETSDVRSIFKIKNKADLIGEPPQVALQRAIFGILGDAYILLNSSRQVNRIRIGGVISALVPPPQNKADPYNGATTGTNAANDSLEYKITLEPSYILRCESIRSELRNY